ncbi:hypothetical protein [Escherichia coli]|uniref:hypothetical protein n=1 Tax=Escherichia coli TaxID=562 RepID=UPI00157A65C9|nr:hypothetical protein [Escherichia coli]
MKHQHGRESAGMIFITRFMNSFLHQASFATGYWYYDRHRSVRLVILVGLAIDQIAQSGLSSLSVIYYSAQLFSPSGSSWDQDDYRSKLLIVFKAGMPPYLNQPEMQSYNVILPYQLKA